MQRIRTTNIIRRQTPITVKVAGKLYLMIAPTAGITLMEREPVQKKLLPQRRQQTVNPPQKTRAGLKPEPEKKEVKENGKEGGKDEKADKSEAGKDAKEGEG